MKLNQKRLLASLLALCLSVGLVPARALEETPSADAPEAEALQMESGQTIPDAEPPEAELPEEESPLPDEVFDAPEPDVLAEYPTSGTCGAAGNEANVTWSIDTGTNTLTISGTGAMMDYASNFDAPWHDWTYNNSYKGSCILSVVIGEGITEIHDLQLIKISSLTLPSTLKKIGSCFSGQKKDYGSFDLTLPAGLESVAARAFFDWDNIRKLTILCPDNVFQHETQPEHYYTFSSCSYLTEVVLPEGWTAIPDTFFSGAHMSSITLPSTLTSIGVSTFSQSSMTSIDLPDGLTDIGARAFEECWNLDLEGFPDTLKNIGRNAFYGCFELSKFNWPTAMLEGGSIGESAFEGCRSMTTEDGHLTIPDTVTIGDKAFRSCSSFTSVTLPSTTDNIGAGLLSNCSGFTSITIPEGWTSIPAETFYYCSNLATVNFPSTPIEIGSRAFSWCAGLTELTLPANVTKLGEEAFIACENLKTLTIENPDLTYSGDAFFQQCGSLTTVNLPEGLKEIGHGMFISCVKLKNINLPDSLTKIDIDAFMSCRALTEVTIPSGVTKLTYREFQNCAALEKVTLPDTMTYIGYESFAGCAALKSIVIPESVTQISNNAFYSKYSTNGLTQIRFLGKAPNIYSEGFVTSDPPFPPNATLYYTAGKSGWTTPKWSNYQYNAYPILGNAEFHDSAEGYYAPIDLYHFTFETADGPLDGVSLSYQGAVLTREAGQTEIAAGMSPVTGEYVTFKREGYHTVSLPTEVLKNFTTVRFTSLEKTTPFIQSAYARHNDSGSYTDLIRDTFSFKGGSTTETTQFYLDINWNGQTPGQIYISPNLLPQDGWELEGGFYDKGYLSVNLTAGDDLYLLAAAGSVVQDAVKLDTLIMVEEFEQDLSICEDNGETVDVPSGGSDSSAIFDLLAKFSFGYEFFEMLPAKVEVSSDGTVKVLLGIKSEGTMLNEDFDTYYGSIKDRLLYTSGDTANPARSLETIRNLLSNRGGGLTVGTASVGIDGEFQVFGYAEGKLAFDPMTGKPSYTFYESAIGMSLEGKASESLQAYVMNVPVYFSGSLGNKFSLVIPLETNTEVTECLVPPFHLAKLENELELRLAAGLGIDKVLSAGVYGKGAGKLSGYLPFSFEDSSLVFESSFGLEAKLFSVFEQDVPIFQGSYTVWPKEETVSTFALRRLAQSDWQPTSRDYLTAIPDTAQYYAVDESNTALTHSLIKEGIYPSADVQFLTTEKGYQYAVWTDDAGEKVRPEANNRTKLYFTYRSKPTNAWYEVQPLIQPYRTDDDGTADFNPVLMEANGYVYVLWQNASRPLTAEDDVTTLPGLLDIACAYCSAGSSSFTLMNPVGTEWYDTAPTVTMVDGTPYALWVSNSANSVFDGTGTYSIHRQKLDRYSQTEMETLVTGLHCVDGLAADGTVFWYSTDTDAESTELSDYAVFCCDGETTERISGAGATKPTVVNGEVVWYENGAFRVGEETVSLATDTDRCQYLVSAAGMKAVVYTVDSDIRQSTLYASFDDGTGWGNPIPLSGISGNISSISADFDADGTLTVLVCERGLDPESPNYLSGTANLNLYTVTPFADLSVTGASYLEHSLVRGGTLDLAADVVNNGMAAASYIHVVARNGEEVLASAAYESFLPSGQSGQYYISVPLTDPAALTDLTVEVTAGGYTDSTPEDNVAPVSLRLNDLAVEGLQISESESGLTVRTMMVNRGQTDLSDLTATLYAADGETVLETCSVAALGAGKGEVISFPVTPGEEAQLLTIQVCAAGLDIMQENLVSNNKLTVRVDGTGTADVPPSVAANVSKNDDGSVSVAAVSSGDNVHHVYIAGYDSDGRLVDVVTSGSDFLGGILTGEGIVKIRVFGLDGQLNPVTDCKKYDV